MIQSPPPPADQVNLFEYAQKNPESVTARAFMNPPTAMKLGGDKRARLARRGDSRRPTAIPPLAHWRASTARSPAAASVDGVRILTPEAIKRCYTEESHGKDEVLMVPTRFSTGFMLTQAHDQIGPNPHGFGHPGAGGSLGFADPDAKVGFGYTMNKMGPYILIDPRARALIDAVYASL